ncbi:hypothetical protein HMI56_005965 [Coelomomyces lativittatus]|nr:hypothetical protein HMI56_005965 [Coelomomyces lativittatus]
MATPFLRQLKAVFQLGPKKAYRQLMSMGDIKPGNLIGKDDQGNEYYEDTKEELWGTTPIHL